ncbi:unnamed protein product [Sphagnum balticum]
MLTVIYQRRLDENLPFAIGDSNYAPVPVPLGPDRRVILEADCFVAQGPISRCKRDGIAGALSKLSPRSFQQNASGISLTWNCFMSERLQATSLPLESICQVSFHPRSFAFLMTTTKATENQDTCTLILSERRLRGMMPQSREGEKLVDDVTRASSGLMKAKDIGNCSDKKQQGFLRKKGQLSNTSDHKHQVARTLLRFCKLGISSVYKK